MYGGIYFSYQLKFLFSLPIEIIWNIRSSNFKQPFRASQKLSLCAFGIFSRVVKPKIIYCANAALITHRKYLFSKEKEIIITNRLAKKEIDTLKSRPISIYLKNFYYLLVVTTLLKVLIDCLKY